MVVNRQALPHVEGAGAEVAEWGTLHRRAQLGVPGGVCAVILQPPGLPWGAEGQMTPSEPQQGHVLPLQPAGADARWDAWSPSPMRATRSPEGYVPAASPRRPPAPANSPCSHPGQRHIPTAPSIFLAGIGQIQWAQRRLGQSWGLQAPLQSKYYYSEQSADQNPNA